MAEASKTKGKVPLGIRVMPRDVATRWNYTYEMLNFAYIYREAYNQVTSNRNMNMRKYELSNKEWKVVKDLSDVLKVRYFFSFLSFLILIIDELFRFSKMRHYISPAQLRTLQR